MNDSDEMDDIIKLYTSKTNVENAIREKNDSNDEIDDFGVLIKDYPKVQRKLDLHGMTSAEAMFQIDNFINGCIAHRVLTVRVITGKGLHSKHFKSVLPELTEKKLAELKRNKKVLSFKKEKDGGAFNVYLIS